jgi:hypothetical protein
MRVIFALLALALLAVPRLMAITGYDLVSKYYQPEFSWFAVVVIVAMLPFAYLLFAVKLLRNSKSLGRSALVAVLLFIVCVVIPLLLNQGWPIPTLLVDIINVARVGAYLAFFAACALVLGGTYFTVEAALAAAEGSPVEPPASLRLRDEPAAESPISYWIDDVPYPWNQPVARELKQHLLLRFDQPDIIRQLIRNAGAPNSSKITFSKGPDDIWIDVLDLAAKEGSLKKLLCHIVAEEQMAAPQVAFIKKLLQA